MSLAFFNCEDTDIPTDISTDIPTVDDRRLLISNHKNFYGLRQQNFKQQNFWGGHLLVSWKWSVNWEKWNMKNKKIVCYPIGEPPHPDSPDSTFTLNTSHLSQILIRRLFRSINPDKRYIKKFLEMIRSLRLLIRNVISMIRKHCSSWTTEVGCTDQWQNKRGWGSAVPKGPKWLTIPKTKNIFLRKIA